ncbi:hypothetical protein M9H77_16134 [Catharanthus roseus]|uniref:Uncharacterized protein n=1 Tax=Catharanthus roseus TaxID=4058 RepID=A0ACC0AZT5_CATRO|nr:hypothetical protein M9H77_16134 [Catharanthus roseus]
MFNPYGLKRKVQPVNPTWGMENFDPFVPRGIASHHITSGTFCILVGELHLSVRPPQCLYKGLRIRNIKTILSSSIVAQLFRSNSLGPLLINGIRDTSNKRYIEENNPVKGGLFRAGSMDNGDRIAVGWLEHPIFRDKEGLSFSDPATMKKYARRAQLGENFEFDRAILKFDGVFRSTPRGWFTFGHASFVLLFFFRHIWHVARTLSRDVFASIDPDLDA